MAQGNTPLSGVSIDKSTWMASSGDEHRGLGWKVILSINSVVSAVKGLRKRVTKTERRLDDIERRLGQVQMRTESEVVSDVPDQPEAVLRKEGERKHLTMWFVDSENVGRSWVDAVLNEMARGDVIRYLFTANSPAIPVAVREACRQSCVTLVPEACTCEQKNALDFQIVSALSMEAARHGHAWRYRIVSSDRGFVAATAYLCRHGLDAAVLVP